MRISWKVISKKFQILHFFKKIENQENYKVLLFNQYIALLIYKFNTKHINQNIIIFFINNVYTNI